MLNELLEVVGGKMISFASLQEVAIRNKGSLAELEAEMPKVNSPAQLARVSDDRYLSEMARSIFRAGFSWRVVDNKWPNFEKAFSGFNPLGVAHFSDEKLEELLTDASIVRHGKKIKAVRDNAIYICDVQKKHESFARFIADWPTDNMVGLWLELKKKGSRLGGNSGPMSLRLMGKDTFLLSADVQAALLNHKFLSSLSTTSKRDLVSVQAVFNRFHDESGLPLSHISRTLAFTV